MYPVVEMRTVIVMSSLLFVIVIVPYSDQNVFISILTLLFTFSFLPPVNLKM